MKKKTVISPFLIGGVIFLVVVMGFNAISLGGISSSLDAKVEEAKELARPAKVTLTLIESSCEECYDIAPLLTTLREADLDIVEENRFSSSSQDASSLIADYAIKRLPAVIVTGEIDKTSIQNFKEENDALIFTGVTAPYEDALSKEITGMVRSIILDAACEECTDYNQIVSSLEQANVAFGEKKELGFSSKEARQLIEQNGITQLPVLLLSRDLDAYPDIVPAMAQLGTRTADYYVIESQAPYVEAESGKLRGLIQMTLLEDQSCKECYDVNIHTRILARFGMAIESSETVDIASSEGQQLLENYDITVVPTVVITGDVEVYDSFLQAWESVGTVEDGDTYVFRTIEAISKSIIYKNLTTGKLSNEAMEDISQQQNVA